MEGWMKTLTWLAVICILSCLLLPLAACDKLGGLKVGFVGGNEASRIYGSYQFFNGTDTRNISAEAGQKITFIYSSTVKEGELTMRVLDSEGNESMKMETGVSGVDAIVVGQAATYKLEITGTDTKGSYDIRWEIK
jgi:hypothetical protein